MASGAAWYEDDSPHLGPVFRTEQARLVKTVKVQAALAGANGSDRRLDSKATLTSDRYRLGHQPVIPSGWLNVQSGHGKSVLILEQVSHASVINCL